ncbi:MAG TPA: hypothetical protein VK843_07685 [Planctomycetota bacterium]|nr:hypothetical protein [Planctomycetota bacterium]
MVVVLLAAGLGFLWQRTGSKNELPSTELARAAHAAEPSAPNPEIDKIETPAQPVPVVDPAASEATGEHVAVEIPPTDFNAKYSGWSLDRLIGAEAILRNSFTDACKPVFAARFEARLFEETILESGQEGPSHSGPSEVHCDTTPEGKQRQRAVIIPMEEYPKLEAMQQEQGWLYSRIYKLRNG